MSPTACELIFCTLIFLLKFKWMVSTVKPFIVLSTCRRTHIEKQRAQWTVNEDECGYLEG